VSNRASTRIRPSGVGSLPATPVRRVGPPALRLTWPVHLVICRVLSQGPGWARGPALVVAQLPNQGLEASSFEEGFEGLRMLRKKTSRCLIVALAGDRASPRTKKHDVVAFHCEIPSARMMAAVAMLKRDAAGSRPTLATIQYGVYRVQNRERNVAPNKTAR